MNPESAEGSGQVSAERQYRKPQTTQPQIIGWLAAPQITCGTTTQRESAAESCRGKRGIGDRTGHDHVELAGADRLQIVRLNLPQVEAEREERLAVPDQPCARAILAGTLGRRQPRCHNDCCTYGICMSNVTLSHNMYNNLVGLTLLIIEPRHGLAVTCAPRVSDPSALTARNGCPRPGVSAGLSLTVGHARQGVGGGAEHGAAAGVA